MGKQKKYVSEREYVNALVMSPLSLILCNIGGACLSFVFLNFEKIEGISKINFFQYLAYYFRIPINFFCDFLRFLRIPVCLPGVLQIRGWDYIYGHFFEFVAWSLGFFFLFFVSSVIFAIVIFKWQSAGLVEEIHEKGRKLSEDAREAQAEVKNEYGNLGVFVHPDVQITSDRETKHILLLGSVGAGKTQILWPIIKQIRAKNKKCIIHDVKGDFASCFEDENFIRLAFWDDRGAVWDIAQDIEDKNDSQEVAACFVEQSGNDPMWANAARMILVAILEKLRQTKFKKWTWLDLSNELKSDFETIQKTIKNYNAEAFAMFEEKNKTTQSIMTNLLAFAAPIHALAKRWGEELDTENAEKFSIKDFLDDEYTGCKTLILQNNQAYENVLKKIYPALIRLMAGRMNGPFFADSKTRELWFILDEFPQLGKLENFGPILETGRSKGLRAILGCQDVQQLQKLYSKEEMESWTGLIGTWIVGKIAGASTTKTVSELIGKKTVKVLQRNRNVELDITKSGDSSLSTSYKTEVVDVMPAADLGRLLGVDNTGITALIIFFGVENGLYKLKWGFTETQEMRAVVVNRRLGYTEKKEENKKGGREEQKQEQEQKEQKKKTVDLRAVFELLKSENQNQLITGEAERKKKEKEKQKKQENMEVAEVVDGLDIADSVSGAGGLGGLDAMQGVAQAIEIHEKIAEDEEEPDFI